MTGTERRQQLIEIAKSLFAQKGFDATSVEEIAAKARVSKPVVYEHFGGKEGLYAVVVDREMDFVVKSIAEAISTGTPRERLEAAALAFLTYVKDHPDGFAVLSHDAPLTMARGGMSGMLNDVAERVGDIFASAFKQAGYDQKTAPIYAHALIGMVTFVGQWWTESRRFSVDRAASHLAALAWMGLRHLPKEPAPVGGKGRR